MFPCPHCHARVTLVVDSRGTSAGPLRRRRKCDACGQRFNTHERLIEDYDRLSQIPFTMSPLERALVLAMLQGMRLTGLLELLTYEEPTTHAAGDQAGDLLAPRRDLSR